jgi:ferritin-like metal-binding protein YciE
LAPLPTDPPRPPAEEGRPNPSGEERAAPRPRAGRKPRYAAATAFDKELRDARDAERRLAAFLPRAAAVVQLSELRTLLRGWAARALHRGRNLQGLRRARGFVRGERGGYAVGVLVAEARSALSGPPSLARDLHLITHLRRILHVHIAACRGLWAWSTRVGDVDAALLFEELAQEYRETDRSLDRLSESAWHHRVEETDGPGWTPDG